MKKFKVIFLMALAFIICFANYSNVSAKVLNSYSVDRGILSTDTNVLLKNDANNKIDINKNIVLAPNVIKYYYSSYKTDRFAYCIGEEDCKENVPGYQYAGRVGDVEVTNGQEIEIDQSKLSDSGLTRISFIAFSDKESSSDAISFYIYKKSINISIDMPQTINPSSITATSDIEDAYYSWRITDENGNTVSDLKGNGKNSIDSTVLGKLSTGKYYFEITASFNEIIKASNGQDTNILIKKTASKEFEIKNGVPTININSTINPTNIGIVKGLSNSTINWEVKKGTSIISNGTNTSVTIPNSVGEYTVIVKETDQYNNIKTATKTFEIKAANPIIKIDNIINPKSIEAQKSVSNSTIGWQVLKDNNQISSGTTSVVTIPQNSGNYVVKATETDVYGNTQTVSKSFDIKINGEKTTVTEGNKTTSYVIVGNNTFREKEVITSGSTRTTNVYYYDSTKCSTAYCGKLKSKTVETISKNRLTKKVVYTYNTWTKLTRHYQQNLVGSKFVVTYDRKLTYFSNKRVKTDTKLYRSTANKYTRKNKIVYRSTGYKSQYIDIRYKSGKTSSRSEYLYNKRGQLKSNKYGKAYLYKTSYKKGKAKKTYRYKYKSNGKKYKAVKVKLRTKF